MGPLALSSVQHIIMFTHIFIYYHISWRLLACYHILPYITTYCYMFFAMIITFYNVLSRVNIYYNMLPHIVTWLSRIIIIITYSHISSHIITCYRILSRSQFIKSYHVLPHSTTYYHMFFTMLITFYNVLSRVTTYYHMLPHIVTWLSSIIIIITYYHISSHIIAYYHILSHVITCYRIISCVMIYYHILPHITTRKASSKPKDNL